MKKLRNTNRTQKMGFVCLKASLFLGSILAYFLVALMKLYPFTQEHTMIGYRDNLYIFGGEVGFSNGVETPLWIYNIEVRTKRVRLFF